ncbi:MAG: hypothetical protein KatS3mg104_1725 [Phycisphaerae bacterium]|nr:MAG: hypothetical protein KatS3mg104_1725 [Phycisphaerae bacterium]
MSNELKSQKTGCRNPLITLEGLENRYLLAFGVTTTPTTYVVDNGANLQFTVLRGGTTSSTIHLGDLTSIKYRGIEMLAPYSVTNRYSHYQQGLSSSTGVTATVDPAGQWILITADDSIASQSSAIQYYAVRRGDDTLYLASLPTNVFAGPGEGRFIAYLNRNVFSNPEAPSDNAGNTGAIEGSDVFGHPDGTTTSKFYNMGRRMIDNTFHGLVGSANGMTVGAWMYMGNREHSAGGPFFKDIDFQAGSAVEIYNYMFSGHTQTENYRQGLHTYALKFNDGSTPPAQLDYSWMQDLNLQGWIPSTQRGSLTGFASGIPSSREGVVGLSNTTAQYWAKIDPTTGAYRIDGIRPGTYTATLYSNELEVGTRTVTVEAGQTTRMNITNTYYLPNATWRIGEWDGTPKGFLNADKIEIMHPSDVRMSSWTSTPNYVVGTHSPSQWPMAQFMGVNNSQRITFTLTSAQASQPQTLRIGITLGFEGARNRITVNAGQTYAWTSSIPSASRDLNSRGITRGTYRGVNQLYTYNIPVTALRAGVNTIDLPLVSGSYVSGSTWLSPSVVYDAIDLVPTANLTNAPVVSSISVLPNDVELKTNQTAQFTAVARDQFGNVIPANIYFSANSGVIDDTGYYIAPDTPGTDIITATAGGGSATAQVRITANPVYTIIYQAENAVRTGGSVDNNHTGFHGTGFYNFPTTNGVLRFDQVDGGQGGMTTIRFRYALGAATSRTGTLMVNGQAQTITFSPTGAWNNWSVYETVIPLNPDNQNSLSLLSTGQDLANIDELQVDTLIPPSPVLSGIVIENGSVQRSMVRTVNVSFDKRVILSSDAIEVRNSSDQLIPLVITPSADGRRYTITFTGSGVGAGSLPDGRYTLAVRSDRITDSYGQSLVSDSVFRFHRLFGDSDGDADVDAADALRFRRTLGTRAGSVGYLDYFDFDQDGDIDGIDALRFQERLKIIRSL